MGAYDCGPNGGMPYGMDATRGPWDPAMDSAVGVGDLADRFLEMDVTDNSKANLVQVMKAVEAAENTIKFLLEENKRLKDELPQKEEELSRLRSNSADASKFSLNKSRDETVGPSQTYPSQLIENSSPVGPVGTLVLHQDELSRKQASSLPNNAENLHYPDDRVNGSLKASSSGQAAFYHTGFSQFSTPSSRSISPNRHHKEGDYDPITSTSGQQMNNSSGHNLNGLWKQDLIRKIREHEEEILQLKRHLADYSVKEEKIRNEKYVLEKRIAHMRMAFDQQQQELVDAASKALSYRQDIIEENIRLTYALQSAQQERSTFVSSLLPLLSEYKLQPPTSDASSIVSELKVLFRHLHEKLIMTEDKLKEAQYQITPWRAEMSNNSNYAPQSPSHPFGMMKPGLEIVPQPPYGHAHSPITSPSNAQTRADREALGHQNLQTNSHGFTRNEHENIGRSSPGNRNPSDVPSADPVVVEDSRADHFAYEAKAEMEDSQVGPHAAGDSSTHWAASGSPYVATAVIDDTTSYHYLPPVLEVEEPGSSLSEAAEDDPLPAIEGLQISGDAYPGRELQASGYSINGTTSCNFEWVRYLEDGSVNYIEGAKQPTYLVTADDVDSYLAIEVQPLDNRKRKGDLVKVFANEQRKITCDPVLQEQIQRILSVGHASFDIQISAGVLDIWENAVLAIKAEGYSVKCSGPRGVVVAEKFSPDVEIIIPYGLPTELLIESGGFEYSLRTTTKSPPRDTIVLMLRLFKMRAVEKKKTRKKVRFFK